jgi:uncharacterized membrane protein
MAHNAARWFRPIALFASAVVIGLAVFFLIRGSWWMSMGVLALWLGLEWSAVWKERRRRARRAEKAE